MRLGGAPPVKVMGYRPEMFIGMPEVQLLPGVGKTILDQVPNPDGAVGDDQHLLGVAQAQALVLCRRSLPGAGAAKLGGWEY